MALRKASLIITFIYSLVTTMNCYGETYPYPGQTLEINTFLSALVGKPSWTLILRDPESQRVLPYLFEFTDKTHYWVAFSAAHSYQVTASTIKWGPYAVINNFCHLENGILTDQSMTITLKGVLSPDPDSFKCYVQKYN